MKILPFGLILLTFSHLCSAGVIFTSVRVHPGFKSGVNPGEDFAFSSTANSSSTSASANFAPSSFSGSASATGDYGTLKASADAVITDYEGFNFSGPCPGQPATTCAYNPAEAYASFGDTFTFGGGVGTGYLVIDIAVTGSATWDGTLGGDAGAQGILNITRDSEGPFGGTLVQSTGFTDAFNYSSPGIQFTYGSPLAVSVMLNAFVWIYEPALSPDTVYSHEGHANYGNTAEVTGLRVFSDPGLQNQVFSASIRAASGAEYPLLADQVPEPGTVFALGGGLLFLAALRRMRRV